MSNIAISYARFSSAPQAEGGSLSRQIDAAEAYAQSQGLTIDPSLRFQDLGVSAWDQRNVQKGALGLLLKAVEQDKVPVGATLIVESFDRLSRAEPLDALGVFTQIIGAGLNLVTLTSPPRRFSRETIRENTFQLFEAVIEMHRAHGESQRKSQLLGKSWEQRRAAALTDKRPMTSKTPLWIGAEGPARNKSFHLIPERAEVVTFAETRGIMRRYTRRTSLNTSGKRFIHVRSDSLAVRTSTSTRVSTTWKAHAV